jgi:hypothetical protein
MGDGSVTIANYSRSTFHKVVRGVAMGYYSGPTIRERVCSFVWKNTAPVTKAVFTTAGTSFVAGSVITCYGKGAVATSPAVYESSTAPGTPYAGMLWWKSDEGTLKIYYNGAWIDAVAASGGMAKIAKVVCVGGETAIDFASIPQIYTDLELVWSARDTAAGTSTSGTRLKMNGDANAANYASSARSGTASGSFVGNTVPASVLGSLFAFHDNDGNAAGVFAGGSLLIPNYTSIAMLKRFIGSFGQTDAGNGECVFTQSGRWLSLNAVNRLTIGTDGTGFKAGSAFTLYGRG